mmetsp:Transcript_9359/g.12570  ORF Transcript_9359/g.12570 Transcript_9359/m.12570 type:complete len:241 (+) Transcript_9359:50-772(+)
MTAIARYTAPMRQEEDGISSSISYECHPSVVFDEIMSQTGMSSDDEEYTSGEESDEEEESDEGEELNSASQSSQGQRQEMPQNNAEDNMINREIGAVDHDSPGGVRGFFSCVASELSLSPMRGDMPLRENGLNDEPTDINRPQRRRESAISMFERRAIDKGIKAGKIYRRMSLNMTPGHMTPPETSSFSFGGRRLSNTDALLVSSGDEGDGSVAASGIGCSMLQAPSSKQTRRSTLPPNL